MEHSVQLTAPNGTKYLFFASGWCPLSNVYPASPITVYGVQYRSAHQFYHALKAKTFKDLRAYTMIMKCASARTQSDLASTIDNFDQKAWDDKADEIMERALRYKFSQNEEAKKSLLATGDGVIVFCTRFQPYWGNGLELEDEMNIDEEKWQGRNKLGKLLMKIRKDLVTA